ncbi:MAG: amidohydrolase family protein [Chloroflexota bacterium]
MAFLRLTADRLLDGGGDPATVGGVAVLIEGERIVAAGPAASVPSPEGARHRAYPGATILPGLIDQHVHLCVARSETLVDDTRTRTDEQLLVWGVGSAERMLRAGVTTVFDCGARGTTGLRIRDAVDAGLGFGPRILASGRPITPTGGHCWFWGGEADGEAAVRAAVARLLDEEGADGIKIMATGGYATSTTDPRLPAYPTDVLAAAAEEAHKRGRYITAHAHGVPGIAAASEAGIDCIQHASMIGMDKGWAFDEDVARAMARRGTRAAVTMMQGVRLRREAGETVDWHAAKRGDPLAVEPWMADARALLDAGVTLVTGTDMTTVTDPDHGEELILEIEGHVEIGMTPLTAIRAATADGARNLGLGDVTGTVRPGLVADLLVVEGAPDVDIHALRRPVLVVRGGTPVAPTRLAEPTLRLTGRG